MHLSQTQTPHLCRGNHCLLVIVFLFWLTAFTSRAAEVGTFTGGDPGEGLDLQGNFIYAIDIGAAGPAGKAGDATFTADDVAGVTVVAGNQIASFNSNAAYGDSASDDILEEVVRSIRWSNAGADVPAVTLQLTGLETGARYKLQLLFGEGCCANRAFDIYLNGKLVADEVNPAGLQGGSNVAEMGVVFREEFTATSATLEIVLDGRTVTTPEFGDHNAILSGATLEKTSSASDTDGDGLSDAWEQQQFGNLTQTPSGDPDGDGLTNTNEFTRSTSATNPDTDGDGLSDGAEVNTHKSDPTKKDSDGDGLQDDVEVNSSKTDPTKADTDGDGLTDRAEIQNSKTDPTKKDSDGDNFNDFDELRLLTNPNDKNSLPKKTSFNLFTGADPGEGLDFDGNFLYAIHVGTENPAGQIRGANFMPDTIEGVVVTAQNVAVNWHPDPSFGDSPADDILESFMNTIRWSDANSTTIPNITVDMANLQVGAAYKLQLLFAEQGWPRGFDIFIDGKQIADDFSPQFYQGGYPKTNGVVVTHSFISRTNKVSILLDGRGVTTPQFSDHNALLQAATLEVVAASADSDNDGLPDAWENDVFGNLTQTSAGDPDNDGLRNSLEFTSYADPNKADSDGDGLADGEEVNTYKSDPANPDTDGDRLTDSEEAKTYKTDPNKSDSDGDSLADGAEVLTNKTDPAKADTDGDGEQDGREVDYGSDPLKVQKPTEISNIVIQAYSGGDPGEGLDLQGNFLYAFNVSSAGAVGKAGDANFTADNVSGVTVIAPSSIASWGTPDFGNSAADDIIERVTRSIRYGPRVRVELAGLSPGSKYKLQMLFFEQCCAGRGFNIYADGKLVAENFVPNVVQGGVNNTAAGAVVAADLVTHREKLVIILEVRTVTDPSLTDPNAILDGLTLEVLNLVAPPTITLTKAASGQFTITTDAKLQVADDVTGPWTTLSGASVTVDPRTVGGRKFYRGTR